MTSDTFQLTIARMRAQSEAYKQNLATFQMNLNALHDGLENFNHELQQTNRKFRELTAEETRKPASVMRLISTSYSVAS